MTVKARPASEFLKIGVAGGGGKARVATGGLRRADAGGGLKVVPLNTASAQC